MSRMIAGVLLALSISTMSCSIKLQKGNPVNTYGSTLWQLIETLIDHPSYTLETIGQALPIQFSEYNNTGYFSFHKGGPLRLADQVLIETAILSIGYKDGVSRLIGLNLGFDGACVTLDEVHLHYPGMTIIGTPRGHSLDEMTTWGLRHPWGEVVFGFKERNPHCLAHVGIDRSPPQPVPIHPEMKM